MNTPPPGDFEACPRHGQVEERIRQLEGREEKQDAAILALQEVASAIRAELAGMRGEVRGALAASKVSGAVIGSLLTTGGAGAVALLVYLLERK